MPAPDPSRLVNCIKLEKELPGLIKPPFRNDFGKEIFEKVSHEAWQMWLAESARYINTAGYDLSSKQGREFLLKQLRIWLGLEEGDMMQTAWTPAEEEKAGEEK